MVTIKRDALLALFADADANLGLGADERLDDPAPASCGGLELAAAEEPGGCSAEQRFVVSASDDM